VVKIIKHVLIPEERVAVLIGRGGSVKKELEKHGVKIAIEKECVKISGNALNVMVVESVVKAIARGFSPETASSLFNEENVLQIRPIELEKNQLRRIKARVIGTKGKTRKNLELLTNTKMSIYGKTVSIIGRPDNVKLCLGSIEKLINGSSHKFVYQYLEKRCHHNEQ